MLCWFESSQSHHPLFKKHFSVSHPSEGRTPGLLRLPFAWRKFKHCIKHISTHGACHCSRPLSLPNTPHYTCACDESVSKAFTRANIFIGFRGFTLEYSIRLLLNAGIHLRRLSWIDATLRGECELEAQTGATTCAQASVFWVFLVWYFDWRVSFVENVR